MKKVSKKSIIILIGSIFLIAIEQLSKIIILGIKDNLPIEVIKNVLSISYLENSGAAFGIKVGGVWSFVIINIIVIAAFIGVVYTRKE